MTSRLIPILLGVAFVAQASGQSGSLDPAFEKIPFDQWLGERDAGLFRWTAGAGRAELSFHQRLVSKVELKVDGRDLDPRRGDGRLVFFVQITSSDGARYQCHDSIELGKLSDNIKAANLEFAQSAFVLPGDYRLAVGILDTATGEHSTRQSQFRVAVPQQRDLLPDAWRGLPPVEFIGNAESPDSWYLPGIQGQLQWATAVHSEVRLNVILNVALSAPAPGSRRAHTGDLAALLPALKAISQTGSSSISEHVSLLDLSRRRAVFHQDAVRSLDWPRLKDALGEANTASIDLHSLSERHHDAQFFVNQVRSLLRASENRCALVVLTPPVAFESGEDLDPISLEGLSACRVFYIRYRGRFQTVHLFDQSMSGRRRGPLAAGPMTRRPPETVVDQLAGTLKPLGPKVFDVETPAEMARAFAEIEKSLRGADRHSSH